MKLPCKKKGAYGIQKLIIRLRGDFYPMNVYSNYNSLQNLLDDFNISRQELSEYYYSY